MSAKKATPNFSDIEPFLKELKAIVQKPNMAELIDSLNVSSCKQKSSDISNKIKLLLTPLPTDKQSVQILKKAIMPVYTDLETLSNSESLTDLVINLYNIVEHLMKSILNLVHMKEFSDLGDDIANTSSNLITQTKAKIGGDDENTLALEGFFGGAPSSPTPSKKSKSKSRSPSPVPSIVSVKSHKSKPRSPAPSIVSVKSHKSKSRSRSPAPSIVSVKSHKSNSYRSKSRSRSQTRRSVASSTKSLTLKEAFKKSRKNTCDCGCESCGNDCSCGEKCGCDCARPNKTKRSYKKPEYFYLSDSDMSGGSYSGSESITYSPNFFDEYHSDN